jgi:hypothetical protein
MITIIGRRLVIPDCDRVLGASGDSGTKLRVRLSEDTVKRYFPDGATVDNVGITLIMEYKENKSAFPSVALHYAKDGVHEGYVTIAETRTPGLLVARALLTYAHGEGNVAMQTEEDYFLVSDDIDASDVTDTGNTYKAWYAVLEDIKSASSSANTSETNAKNSETTASGYATQANESANMANSAAEMALASAERAETSATTAKGHADKAEADKNEVNATKKEIDKLYRDEISVAVAGVHFSTEMANNAAESAKGHAEDAKLSKVKAEEFVSSAKTSADTASAYSKSAKTYKTEAETARTQAVVYANQASDYADIAKDAAERATAVLVKTGDIDAALDAILEIQESLMPSEGTLG